jgi:lipid A 3-O-deacylase
MKNIILSLTLMFGIVFSAGATSNKSYSIDYIQGEGDVTGIKLAMQYHVDWLKQYSEHLNMYFESSLNLWEYGAENEYDSNLVLAISPVIQYPIAQLANKPIFVEFGIGVSLLDDTVFAGKNVSTHYQFEDRLGLVMQFGKNNQQSVALRYFHYSNAGFKRPNPGLDFIALNYTRFY